MADMPAQELINYQQAKIERQEEIIKAQAKRLQRLETAETKSAVYFAEKLKVEKLNEAQAKRIKELETAEQNSVINFAEKLKAVFKDNDCAISGNRRTIKTVDTIKFVNWILHDVSAEIINRALKEYLSDESNKDTD